MTARRRHLRAVSILVTYGLTAAYGCDSHVYSPWFSHWTDSFRSFLCSSACSHWALALHWLRNLATGAGLQGRDAVGGWQVFVNGNNEKVKMGIIIKTKNHAFNDQFFHFFCRSFGAGCLQFCCWHSCMRTRWSLATGTGTSPQFCPHETNERMTREMPFFQEKTWKHTMKSSKKWKNRNVPKIWNEPRVSFPNPGWAQQMFFGLASCSIEIWFQSSLVWNTLQLHWRSENCQNFVRHRNRSHVKLPSWLSWSQILQVLWFSPYQKRKTWSEKCCECNMLQASLNPTPPGLVGFSEILLPLKPPEMT